MEATMKETFIADWQNYLYELGLVISWDTEGKTNPEATMQSELRETVGQSLPEIENADRYSLSKPEKSN
ncbi:hypothetical protein LEP3755_21570 [Leptolyngbya sp. NIES-3755]|nr:hypothetical protein LEP3755_21570 [Leptolyngbya sp. NIES-3755]